MSRITNEVKASERDKWVKPLIRSCQKRAKVKGFEMDIDAQYLADIWDRQTGRCALTGTLFNDAQIRGSRKRPYIPSVDRIKNDQGYVKGNVRLVCSAANHALMSWGDKVFMSLFVNMILSHKIPKRFLKNLQRQTER